MTRPSPVEARMLSVLRCGLSILENLRFLIDCQPYIASGTIIKVSIGQPLMINSGTYLHNEADRLGLILDSYDDTQWLSKHDSGNDYVRRSLNRLITLLLVDSLGYPLSRVGVGVDHQNLQKLKTIKHNLKKALDEATSLVAN